MTEKDRYEAMDASLIETPWGTLRHVTQDGEIVWKLRCPMCGHEGQIDDDQLHGRVSLDHTNCGVSYEPSACQCTWHETHDYWPYVRERAEFLARLRQRMAEDKPLLDRLARGPDA